MGDKKDPSAWEAHRAPLSFYIPAGSLLWFYNKSWNQIMYLFSLCVKFLLVTQYALSFQDKKKIFSDFDWNCIISINQTVFWSSLSYFCFNLTELILETSWATSIFMPCVLLDVSLTPFSIGKIFLLHYLSRATPIVAIMQLLFIFSLHTWPRLTVDKGSSDFFILPQLMEDP